MAALAMRRVARGEYIGRGGGIYDILIAVRVTTG